MLNQTLSRAVLLSVSVLLWLPVETNAEAVREKTKQAERPQRRLKSNEQREQLADLIAELMQLEKQAKELRTRAEEIGRQVTVLIEQLVQKDPSDLYGQHSDQLMMAVMREYHPELAKELEQQFRKKHIALTKAVLKGIRQALEVYYMDAGLYPTTEQGLKVLFEERGGGPYLDLSFPSKDPWGHPFVYRFPSLKGEKSYDLFSVGPDGKEGTADDIE